MCYYFYEPLVTLWLVIPLIEDCYIVHLHAREADYAEKHAAEQIDTCWGGGLEWMQEGVKDVGKE